MSRPKNSILSESHKKNISAALTGRKKSVIYTKFSYDEYIELYNDFLNLNLKDNTIGIEQYCKMIKKISSTTFRKFIKEHNLYCPKAKWNSNRIENQRKYMIEVRFGMDYANWLQMLPNKKSYYMKVRSLTEKQPLHIL